MPIIYYIYKDGKLDEKSLNEIRKYLIIAQVKQLFGAAGNSALAKTKKAIDQHKIKKEGFDVSYFKDVEFLAGRRLAISDDDIEKMLSYEKGTAYSFMVLSLLYPEIKLNKNDWHQDHMHPYSKFSNKNLNRLGLSAEKILDWKNKANRLPNLQLLEGRENESKNDMDLKIWLKNNPAKYLPKTSYELENFENFYSKRKSYMKKALKSIFQ